MEHVGNFFDGVANISRIIMALLVGMVVWIFKWFTKRQGDNEREISAIKDKYAKQESLRDSISMIREDIKDMGERNEKNIDRVHVQVKSISDRIDRMEHKKMDKSK